MSSRGLSEREIIEKIWKHLDVMPGMVVPFGDDVSAVRLDEMKIAVLKTDMLVAETDVPSNMNLWQAARKAVVMNVSDFAAKGVKPLAILVSLGVPRKLAVEEKIEQIAEGLNAGAREYNTYILGGDTNEAADLTISISLFGITRKDKLMLRSGAKPNDLVAVTGLFGKTAAGLKILLEEVKTLKETRDALINAVLMPKARLREGLALSETGAVTASIDSSDGLAWSLYEIAKASNVGFKINKVPLAREVEKFAEINGLNSLDLTFYGGEEYELVLTVKPKLWRKAKESVEKVGGELILIGEVTAEKEVVLEVNGERQVIEPKGWEHFKSL